jgi:tetratricopeptide (TPR) repeat protein
MVVFAIPKKNGKIVEKSLKTSDQKKNLNLVDISSSRFINNGTSLPEIDNEKKFIRLNKVLGFGLSSSDSNAMYNILLKVKDEKDFDTIKDLVSRHLGIQNKETKEFSFPSCKCGSLKSLNADYPQYSEQGEIPEWMHAFCCYNCILNFCQLQQITKKILFGSMDMGPQQFLNILQTQLKIAKEFLDDKLAIAHSKMVAGVFLMNIAQDPDAAMKIYEEAYEILKNYDQHENDYFYDRMVENYQNIILFLGEGYQNLKQYDKAMEFLQKSLEYDIKQGNKVNIGKSKTSIARLLKDMKKYDEAEKVLFEALNLKKEAGIAENDRTMFVTYLGFVNLYNDSNQIEKATKYISIIESTFSDLVSRNPSLQELFQTIHDKLN